ncbi:hypothetical protein M7I_7322 [Glarea lozoyensis 74030]|uniref:Uncharacterized protein n=1 Tax=Glarea lozoyensis (strain ATCC 74030 / MF5533) TaxID=1104152 RepID=H0EWZ7_GLAL7|nr:hypothetical protein M7I_7322 [Glarea lozoyensis 74030]
MFATKLKDLLALGTILTTFSTVVADSRNFNPTGAGCVDQSGFLSCYQTQASAAVDCENFCVTSTKKGSSAAESCSKGCGGKWLAANIGCWIQSCWNELAAISYFGGTGLVQDTKIPFYPPPDNASAGSCSCNLGHVYGNITVVDASLACTAVVSTGDFAERVSEIRSLPYSSVITPIAFNAQAGVPTGTVDVIAATADGTPTARNTATKSATSSKSGATGVSGSVTSAPTATSTPSGAQRSYGRNWLWFGSLVFAALFYLI